MCDVRPGVKPRTLCMVGNISTIDLHPSPPKDFSYFNNAFPVQSHIEPRAEGRGRAYKELSDPSPGFLMEGGGWKKRSQGSPMTTLRSCCIFSWSSLPLQCCCGILETMPSLMFLLADSSLELLSKLLSQALESSASLPAPAVITSYSGDFLACN